MSRLEPANFATALTAAAGVGVLLSAVPAFESRLAAAEPLAGVLAHHLGLYGSGVAGLFLLQLANQLRRRRRRAWQLTTGLLLIALVASAIQELDWSLVVPLLPLALLLLTRRRFTAPSDPPSLFRLLAFAPLCCSWCSSSGWARCGSIARTWTRRSRCATRSRLWRGRWSEPRALIASGAITSSACSTGPCSRSRSPARAPRCGSAAGRSSSDLATAPRTGRGRAVWSRRGAATPSPTSRCAATRASSTAAVARC